MKSDENTGISAPKSSSGKSDEADEIEKTEKKIEGDEATSSKGAEIVIGDDNLIEIEDPDDYLMYLETILMKIHARFYEFYDDTTQVRSSCPIPRKFGLYETNEI